MFVEHFYQPRSRGDNTFGSTHLSICLSISLLESGEGGWYSLNFCTGVCGMVSWHHLMSHNDFWGEKTVMYNARGSSTLGHFH